MFIVQETGEVEAQPCFLEPCSLTAVYTTLTIHHVTNAVPVSNIVLLHVFVLCARTFVTLHTLCSLVFTGVPPVFCFH